MIWRREFAFYILLFIAAGCGHTDSPLTSKDSTASTEIKSVERRVDEPEKAVLIYDLTFGDTSNFRLLTLLNHSIPDRFFISDTSARWGYMRFWLPEFDKAGKRSVVQTAQTDEHHPYFHSYLFRDKNLDEMIPDSEKRELSEIALQFLPETLRLNKKRYKTIPANEFHKGFYFKVSPPLFARNNKFAFIDLLVYYRENRGQPLDDALFGTIAVVFENKENGWAKIAVKDWLIL